MNLGKKITIFLSAGLPKGLREVKIDQWSGKAVCGPRNALAELINLPEVETGACVYFLIGNPTGSGLPEIYVGEADGFKERIKVHDNKLDWWEEVAVFVSRDESLTKTGIQYLESECVRQLKAVGKCILKNRNVPRLPTVPKEDISGLQQFYENISIIMPLLGHDIFVADLPPQDEIITGVPLRFFCKKGGNVLATAHLNRDGKMRVLKGSTASFEETQSFQTHPYKKLKDELVEMGRLVKKNDVLRFTDDYVFDSSSAACDVVLGRSASGPLEWKTEEGISLKTFLESQVND